MTYQRTDFQSGWVAVPNAEIYWEATGNPEGVPVLYLHGGPGSSLGAGGYRKRHDPEEFWTVGIDQRGCGKSTPAVQDDLENLSKNNTQQLLADIEVVREHLEIQKWIVTGISLGSTLVLAYALAHPERVMGIALMAVTTTSREEVNWITEGVGRIFPEAWHEFAAASGQMPGERIVEAYARRLAGPDRSDALLASAAWDRWEAWHISFGAPRQPGPMIADERQRLTFTTLVTHYFSHDGFLGGETEILRRVHELAGIAGHLIHGRLDVSGPLITPWRLHQQWEGSTLRIIEDEGHGGTASIAALTAAVEEIKAGL